MQGIGYLQDGATLTMIVHDSPLTDSLRIVHGCDWQGGKAKTVPWSRLHDLDVQGLSELFCLPKLVTQLHDVIHQCPCLQLTVQILPLSHTLLCIELMITSDVGWNEHVHGSFLSLIVFVEDG